MTGCQDEEVILEANSCAFPIYLSITVSITKRLKLA